MKTTLPLILGIAAGWIAFGELYIPAEGYREVFEMLRDFAMILASMAFILGGLNLVQVNASKIRRREEDWPYKLIMLVGAAVMGLAGIAWHTFGDQPEPGTVTYQVASAGETSIAIDAARSDAVVRIDGGEPMRAHHSGDPADVWSEPGSEKLAIPVEPGEHNVIVTMPVSGYASFNQDVTVAAGQMAVVETDLPMLWGADAKGQGRVFTWLYDHVFFPCNATMFALLAFFIASAAFRAFRARNVESALLLGAAILVMLGLVPIGRAIDPFFPWLADWIVEIPNNAGRRAIMMGAALGAIATGLRVILGLERSHLGRE